MVRRTRDARVCAPPARSAAAVILRSDRALRAASLQWHDVDALPSRGDCGAFGAIAMLTFVDLAAPAL